MQLNYQPSNELSLLLNAATLGCRHNRIDGGDIPWQHIDWHKTLKLANFHGLSCWLAEYLKDEEQVPSEIKKRLAQKQRGQLLSYMYTEQQKCDLVSALNEAGIRFAILKGVAIAKPLYQKRWYYRAVVDMDILIDPEQLKQAFERLKAIGYCDVSQNPLGESEFEQIATNHQHLNDIEHSLQFPNRKLCLDVHWKLRGNSLMPLSYQTLFNSIVDDSEAISRLSEPLEFIYLCVHGMSDGWRKLKGVVDVLYYAQNISDWSSINETAERLGLSHIVHASLAVCDFFYGTCYGPKQLNKKELTLLRFVLNGFERDDELPSVHSYLDRSNIYVFIKTTLSWWLALRSDFISPTTAIRHLLTPNKADLAHGQLAKNNQLSLSFLIRITRVMKKYFVVKD